MAGSVFGFANDDVAAEKVEAVTVENRSEVKLTVVKNLRIWILQPV